MSDKQLIEIGSTWRHKKDGYLVVVEKSEWLKKTQFRRVVPLNAKAGNPFRTKQTHYFLYEFEQTRADGRVTTAEEDYINALRWYANNDSQRHPERAREVLRKHKQG